VLEAELWITELAPHGGWQTCQDLPLNCTAAAHDTRVLVTGAMEKYANRNIFFAYLFCGAGLHHFHQRRQR
jgi:hypothetical protein